MANLYQLSAAFMACEQISDNEVVDTNTGEVLNIEYLDNLQMERNEKLESCACYIKNVMADIAAFKAEIDRLTKTKRVMENKAERMKQYIADNMTEGEKLTTPRCSLSWRKSEVVEVEDGVDIWSLPTEAIKVPEPYADKAELKRLIKEGVSISGVRIVTNNNLQVK